MDSVGNELWHTQGRLIAFRDIALVDLWIKLGRLEFLTKAGLNWIPVVGPLMIIIISRER